MSIEVTKIQEEYERCFGEVFEELKDFGGNIIVKYGSVDTDEDGLPDTESYPEITSVNECKSVKDFELKLLLIQQKAITDIKGTNIKEGNKPDFLSYTLIRLPIFTTEEFVCKRKRKDESPYIIFHHFILKDDTWNEWDSKEIYGDSVGGSSGEEAIEDYSFDEDEMEKSIGKDVVERDLPAYTVIWENTIKALEKEVEELIKGTISVLNSEFKSDLIWQGTDTDLLELITALVESKKINNQTKNLTRKDAIKYFENIFNLTIKDSESKLKRATDRKTEQAPFLESLKQAFIEYCSKKDK